MGHVFPGIKNESKLCLFSIF